MINLLCCILFSCTNSFDKKIKTLPNCSSQYIKNISVEARKNNNIGNPTFNFILSPVHKDEYYFYLRYKNQTHFLFYSKDNSDFNKNGLHLHSPFNLLLNSSIKVKNEGYKIIPNTPEFRYEMSDEDIRRELLNILDDASVISQNRKGEILNTYPFCESSTVTFTTMESYNTACFIDYHPEFKKFNDKFSN